MEELLPRCLDSIIGQTFADFEVILVNDGSVDSSGQICDEYAKSDSRIKAVHKKNAGVSEARNSGIELATGLYLSFVDPDDWLEKNMYEVLVAVIDQSHADVIRFNAFRNDQILNQTNLKGNYRGEDITKNIVLPMIGAEKYGGPFLMGVPWTYAFRREVITENGILFSRELRRCEDRLFCITALLHAQSVFFVDDVLYHYTVNSGSLSNKYDPIRWEQELLFLDKLKNEYRKKLNPDDTEKADRRIKTDYVLRAIISVDNVFFSKNNNSFAFRYRRVKQIITNNYVRNAAAKLEAEPLGAKGKIVLWCVKKRHALLLSLFQTALLIKNRI